MPAKFDYDSDEFYEEIMALALQGFNDAEIADALFERFGQNLDPDTFSAMKHGRYSRWTKEENERRSARLDRVLTRGRRKTTGIVRGRYLKAALGGIKLKNKAVTTRHIRTPDGDLTGEDEIQTVETETETPPNIQALATWLYHHDEEWRNIQSGAGKIDEIPTDIKHGIDISKWIQKEVSDAADEKDEKENPNAEVEPSENGND